MAFLAGTLMIFKGHKENAISPISLIDSGISILVRLSQPKKACDSMHVTELGMITLFKLLQLAKVEYLIVVTELGIIMLVRFLHIQDSHLTR